MSNGICRDYERGVCDRGDRCKYEHPANLKRDDKSLPICKDFQNKGCDRDRCKFLHITRDEEDHYNSTGQLPPHRGRSDKVREMSRGGPWGGGGGGGRRRSFGGPPPMASGGPPCKDFLNNKCDRHNCKFRHVTEREMALEAQLQEVTQGRDMGGPMYGKRSRPNDGAEYIEENEMLKRKVSDLQKQVVDLRQMNDALYEQNSKYREQLRTVIKGSYNT